MSRMIQLNHQRENQRLVDPSISSMYHDQAVEAHLFLPSVSTSAAPPTLGWKYPKVDHFPRPRLRIRSRQSPMRHVMSEKQTTPPLPGWMTWQANSSKHRYTIPRCAISARLHLLVPACRAGVPAVVRQARCPLSVTCLMDLAAAIAGE